MKLLINFMFILICSVSFGQKIEKPILGIAQFTSGSNSKFTPSITEMIVKTVTNTKKFIVVDRSSYDKVKEELEFQKSEQFIDSKNVVKQDAALASEFLLIGDLVKMNVFAMKNSDGSINGYKSSYAFTLKINNVETGETIESATFQTKVSDLMFTSESAINEAFKTVEVDVINYFNKTFPFQSKIVKVTDVKKDQALKVLIIGGKNEGFSENKKIKVDLVEEIEGRKLKTQIAQLKITKINGDFSEANVLSGGQDLLKNFNANLQLVCVLIDN
ncbi:CsgG/HfaB family protein [Empedobacter falsenii]